MDCTMDSMDTEWLNGIKEQVKQKVGATLKEESWTNFVEKVAWWLHAEKRRNDRIIIDAAAGLIKYGIMEEGDLIDVDNDKTELRKALEAKGVPPIVCDMLFNKYVPQQQEDASEIKWRPVLEFAKQQLENKTEEKSMSKAGYSFARLLLNGIGIQVRVDSVNTEDGSSSEPTAYVWMVNTKDDDTVRPGEHFQTPGAKNWFMENFLAHEEAYGLKVVTGHRLPDIRGNRKKARGKGDLVIGKKVELEATPDAYDFAMGLIELKQEIYPIKKAQNVLELASLCTISRFGRNCSLLATDCNTKWELYWFEDTKTIVRRVYRSGRKCWEDFKALLDVAETKVLTPPSKLRPVLPNFEEALDVEEAEGLNDQDLDGFDASDSKMEALDRHAQLDALANYLGDLYGERPVIPAWARAERTCPDYYQ